jgi:hypothetical protein
MHARIGLSGLAMLACLSCSSPDDVQPPPSSGSPDAAAFPADMQAFFDAYVARMCPWYMTCPIANDDVLYDRIVLGSVENCRAVVSHSMAVSIANQEIATGIAAGVYAYDPAQAQACLDGFNGCSGSTAPACQLVFSGHGQAATACHRNEDCAPGLYCSKSSSSVCDGTCAARIAIGQDCRGITGECDQSGGPARCIWSNSSSRGVCRLVAKPAVGLGQPCGTLVDLDAPVGCAEGLWCKIPSLQAAGTCMAPLPKGTTCDDPDDVCEAGSVCIATGIAADASTVVPEVCAPFIMARTAGARCSADSHPVAGSVLCDVTRTLSCVNGACLEAPLGTEGAACTTNDLGVATCVAGLRCIWDSSTAASTCAKPKKAGETCSSNRQCEVDCDFATLKCVDHTCG